MKRIITLMIIVNMLFVSVITVYAEEDMALGMTIEEYLQENLVEPEPVTSISIQGKTAKFTYDIFGRRTNSVVEDEVVMYDYKGEYLISENRNGMIIDYVYNNEKISGFVLGGKDYWFEQDEDGTVLNIKDSNDVTICHYEYHNMVATVYKYENGKWLFCNDPDFVGNINRIRYGSYYWEEVLQLYYMYDGSFYNPIEEYFIKNLYTLKNEELLNDTYATANYASNVMNLYMQLINSSTYGKAITNVTESKWNQGYRWYDGMATYELVARLLYSEDTSPNKTSDRAGAAYIIANRVNDRTGDYKNQNSVWAVATHKSQFSGINPGSYSDSNKSQALGMKTNRDSGWTNATLYACALYYSTDHSDLSQVFGRPLGITTQKQFVSVDWAYNGNGFSIKSGKFYQNNNELENPAVAGTGVLMLTSSSTLQGVLSAYKGQNKLFFYGVVGH